MQTQKQVQIKMRRMQEKDVAALEQLVHAAYRGGKAEVSWKNEHDIVRGPRITEAGLKELLVREDARVLVAERAEAGHESGRVELCGCVLIEKEDARTVVLGMLAVGPNAQNLGLGRQLVEAAEQAAREEFGAQVAHMHVACVREELLAWYQRLGYALTGEMKPFPGPEAGIEALQEGLQFAVIEKKLIV